MASEPRRCKSFETVYEFAQENGLIEKENGGFKDGGNKDLKNLNGEDRSGERNTG